MWGYSLEQVEPHLIPGLRANHIQQVAIGQEDNIMALTGPLLALSFLSFLCSLSFLSVL
jgi:hypothetical protein